MASKQDLATTESAASMAAKIRRKEVSPVEVMDAAIARIEAHNPKIHALIIMHLDEARTSAKAAVLPLLLLAILVDRVTNSRLATFYRVILLIPAVIPSTLIFVLWKWMYNYQAGPINHFLVETTGLFTLQNAPQWLGGAPLTLPLIAVMEIWWGLGYHTIFFIAGLAAISKDLPDAARIDGASEW